MKKMFLSVAIVIAAGKIISQVFERRTSTTYVYMTSTNVNVAISEMKRGLQVENCINIKVTKQKLDHNAGDCEAMNGSDDWWD